MTSKGANKWSISLVMTMNLSQILLQDVISGFTPIHEVNLDFISEFFKFLLLSSFFS
jgi:flagellar assembly factor FliW